MARSGSNVALDPSSSYANGISRQKKWKKALKKILERERLLGREGRGEVSLVIQLSSLFNKLRGTGQGRISRILQGLGKFNFRRARYRRKKVQFAKMDQ